MTYATATSPHHDTESDHAVLGCGVWAVQAEGLPEGASLHIVLGAGEPHGFGRPFGEALSCVASRTNKVTDTAIGQFQLSSNTAVSEPLRQFSSVASVYLVLHGELEAVDWSLVKLTLTNLSDDNEAVLEFSPACVADRPSRAVCPVILQRFEDSDGGGVWIARAGSGEVAAATCPCHID